MQDHLRGLMVAEAATYGADKLWCVLEGIPVSLDSESDSEDRPAKRVRGGGSCAGQSFGALASAMVVHAIEERRARQPAPPSWLASPQPEP